jgi:hypothetical protein
MRIFTDSTDFFEDCRPSHGIPARQFQRVSAATTVTTPDVLQEN